MLKLWKSQYSPKSVSQEVTEFVTNSRRFQTVYARFGGSQERIFDVDDERLVDYLRDTLHYNKCSVDYNNSFVSNIVNEFMNKILRLKTASSDNKEVRLTVIWIYLFNYEKKTTESTPVVKIFLSQSSVMYIDTKGDTYDTWEQYLNTRNLPNALMCIPRNGTYYEENGNFIFNYLRTVPSSPNNEVVAMFTPYPERRIFGLFTEKQKNKFWEYMARIPEYYEKYIIPVLIFISNRYLEHGHMDGGIPKRSSVIIDFLLMVVKALISTEEPPFMKEWKKFISTPFKRNDLKANLKAFMELIIAVAPFIVLIMIQIFPNSVPFKVLHSLIMEIVDKSYINYKNTPLEEHDCSGGGYEYSVPKKSIEKFVHEESTQGYIFVISKDKFPYSLYKHVGSDFQLIVEDDGNFCVLNNAGKKIGCIIKNPDLYVGHFEKNNH